jgi:hypothetical protein
MRRWTQLLTLLCLPFLLFSLACNKPSQPEPSPTTAITLDVPAEVMVAREAYLDAYAAYNRQLSTSSGEGDVSALLRDYQLKNEEYLDLLEKHGIDPMDMLGVEAANQAETVPQTGTVPQATPSQSPPGAPPPTAPPASVQPLTLDGVQIRVPEGEVTFEKIDPQTVFPVMSEDVSYGALAVHSTVKTFETPAEIRLPLPTGCDPEKGGWFLVVRQNDNGVLEALPQEIDRSSGSPVLVARADHFSNIAFAWMSGWVPMPRRAVVPTPYYSQAESLWCWAATTQMLAEHGSPSGASLTQLCSLISAVGEPKGIENSDAKFQKWLKTRIPKVEIIDYKVSWLGMETFIQWCLASGRPVVVFTPGVSHAWTLVGYDQNKGVYLCHDPMNKTGSVYQELAPEKLSFGEVLWAPVRVIVGPKSTKDPPAVSTSIFPNKLIFVDVTGVRRAFIWDHTVAKGYSLKPAQFVGQIPVSNAIPGNPHQLILSQEEPIQLVGTHPTEPTKVEVVASINGKPLRTQQMTLRPRKKEYFRFKPILAEEFHQPSTAPTTYEFKITATPAKGVGDSASFKFTVEPAVALTVKPNWAEPSTAEDQTFRVQVKNLPYEFENQLKDMDQMEYRWNFNDGSPLRTGSQFAQDRSFQITHRFAKIPDPATIEVKLFYRQNPDEESVMLASTRIPAAMPIRQVSTPWEDLPDPPEDDFDLEAELEKQRE